MRWRKVLITTWQTLVYRRVGFSYKEALELAKADGKMMTYPALQVSVDDGQTWEFVPNPLTVPLSVDLSFEKTGNVHES